MNERQRGQSSIEVEKTGTENIERESRAVEENGRDNKAVEKTQGGRGIQGREARIIKIEEQGRK